MGANDKVTRGKTIYGRDAWMGRRTAAHLDKTEAALKKKYPNAKLKIIQGAYNTSVKASAGTHDKDAALDLWIEGLDPWDAQRFLREQGWAAWYRYPPAFGKHLHAISLGYGNAPVGEFVPGQVSDYYNHRTGLKGHAADSSWHPNNIAATLFNYNKYLKETEDMQKEEVRNAPIVLKIGDKTVKTDVEGAMQDMLNRTMAQGDKLRKMDAKLDKIVKKLGI